MFKQWIRRLRSLGLDYSVYRASSGKTLVIESRILRGKVRRVLYSRSPRVRTYYDLPLNSVKRQDGLTDVLEVTDTSGRLLQIERHHSFTKEGAYLEVQSHMYLYVGSGFDPETVTIVPACTSA